MSYVRDLPKSPWVETQENPIIDFSLVCVRISTLLVEPVPKLCPTLSGTKYSKRSDFVARVTIRVAWTKAKNAFVCVRGWRRARDAAKLIATMTIHYTTTQRRHHVYLGMFSGLDEDFLNLLNDFKRSKRVWNRLIFWNRPNLFKVLNDVSKSSQRRFSFLIYLIVIC
jgi:hypothetical protein